MLAPLVAGAAPAKPTLGATLRHLTQSSGVNFVLAAEIEFDLPLARPVTDLQQLQQALEQLGLKRRVLANGDWLIQAPEAARVKLAPLEVADTPWVAPLDLPLARVASTTDIDASTIEALGDRELDDLFLRAANVYGSGDEFYIRGIPSHGNLNTLGNATAFVDGMPLPDFLLRALPLNTWDMSTIAFERGPRAGDAAGPFATYAGSIALQTTPPQFDQHSRLLLRADEHGDHEIGVMLNQPLISEELAARLVLDYQSQAGTLRSMAGAQEVDSAESRLGRLSLRWEPAALSGLQVDLSASHVRGQAGPQRLTSERPFEREGEFAPFERSDLDSDALSLHARFEDRAQRLWYARLAASDTNAALNPTRTLDQGIDPPFVLVDQAQSRLAFADVGLNLAVPGGRLGLSVSAGSTRETELLRREGRLWDWTGRLSRTSALVDYAVASGPWSWQTRLRYNRDRLHRRCLSRPLEPVGQPALACFKLVELFLLLTEQPFTPFSGEVSTWLPELTMTRSIAQDQEWFVRYYRGANAPGAVSSANLEAQPFWVFYPPERSDNGEFGWRGLGLAGVLDAHVTAFYGVLKRQWSFVQGDLGGVGAVTSSGQSKHYGVEFDGQWHFRPNHRLLFSLGWLKTRYGDVVPFELDAQLDSVLGNEFPGAPAWSGSLAYLGHWGAHWRVSVAASFHDEAFANANNVEAGRIPSAAIVDLKLSRQWRHWGLSVFLRNALDEDYLATTPNIRRANARIDYALGRPRSVGLSLELSY